MRLYELKNNLRALESVLDSALNAEGEEPNQEVITQLVSRIDELCGSLTERYLFYGVIIKEIRAEIQARQLEITRQKLHIRRAERNAAWKEAQIMVFLEKHEQPLQDERVTLKRVRVGGKPAVIIADETNIPEEYWREKIERSPDKEKIRLAVENGREFLGVTLQRSFFYLKIE